MKAQVIGNNTFPLGIYYYRQLLLTFGNLTLVTVNTRTVVNTNNKPRE